MNKPRSLEFRLKLEWECLLTAGAMFSTVLSNMETNFQIRGCNLFACTHVVVTEWNIVQNYSELRTVR